MPDRDQIDALHFCERALRILRVSRARDQRKRRERDERSVFHGESSRYRVI